MTEPRHGPRLEGLRALEDSFQQHCSARGRRGAESPEHLLRRRSWWRIRGGVHRPLVRRLLFLAGGAVALAGFAVGGLWLRLASGPIELNLASPFLAAAIEENIGRRHEVEIGGTQIERDATGRPSLRI